MASVLLNVGVNYKRVQQPPGSVLMAGSVVFVDVNPLDDAGEGVPLDQFEPSDVTYRAVVNGKTVGEIHGDAKDLAQLGPFEVAGRGAEMLAQNHGLYTRLKYGGIGPGTFGLRIEVDVKLKNGEVAEGEYTFDKAD